MSRPVLTDDVYAAIELILEQADDELPVRDINARLVSEFAYLMSDTTVWRALQHMLHDGQTYFTMGKPARWGLISD